MKSQIVNLRKKIYQNLKNKALSYEDFNPELQKYLKDQIRYSNREFNIVEMEDLKKQVLNTDVLFLGDFHTFDQNIRNVLRILKFIISNKNNCIIGLEMVAANKQFFIDTYLEGHITELEFLESINYHDSWRFPWTHYKLIYELAKENNIKIIGLNRTGSLEQRDHEAANIIQEARNESPNSSFLVLYGELHISPNKIPKLLNQKCPGLEMTILHQNLDEVYWKLIAQDIEQGIVSFTPNEYCIISAPPWIKYESMIYWYENLCDDPDFDIHHYIIENGKKIFSDDTKDNFLNIVNMIINHLNIVADEEEIENFNLHDHTNLEYIEEQVQGLDKNVLTQFYDYLIATNKSFQLPGSSIFYCSSYSMNRISYLAGIHILHIQLKSREIYPQDILNSRSSTKKIILFIWEAMSAYFFSKIINPHRKCEMYLDLQTSLNDKSLSQKEIHWNQISLKVLDGEDISSLTKGLKLTDLYEISLNVGHILGEYLYIKTTELKNENIYKNHVKDIMVDKRRYQKLQKIILRDIPYQNHNKRYF